MRNIAFKAFKFSIIYGIATAVLSGSGFLLLPIYTRHISPAEYGIFSIIGIFATVLIFVCDFGMINALVRWYFDYKETDVNQRKMIVSTVFLFFIIFSSIITTFLLAFTKELSLFLFRDSSYKNLIKLMVLTNFFTILTWVPFSVFRIKENPFRYLIFSVVRMALIISSALIFLFFMGRGLKGIFEANLCAFAVFAAILIMATYREYILGFSLKDLKGMLRFALPFIPVLLFTWVIDFSDRYLLGRLATLEDTGLYSVGYKFGQIVFLADKAFLIGWIPIAFSIIKRSDYKEVFGRIFSYFIAAVAFIGLIISVFSQEMVGLFATPDYMKAATIVPLICASYLFYGFYIYSLSGLVISKNIVAQPVILFVGAAINIVLNIMLIPDMKMMGAAIATLISYIFIAIVTFLCAQKIYPIRFELNNALKVFIFSAGLFLVLNLTLHNKGVVFVSGLIIKVATLSLFPIILYLTGFFKKREVSYERV